MQGLEDFDRVPEYTPGQPPARLLERATVFGTLAAALLMAPIGDDERLRIVGREMAVLVWRHLVHDLTDYVVVRRAVLDFASCRYWMQRLAVEAETGTAARRPLVARTDKVWPLWHRLAEEIRAAEESDA